MQGVIKCLWIPNESGYLRRSQGVSQDSKTGRPKIFLGVAKYFRGEVALKVFCDVATETVAIKHMCWSYKAIIVFLNSGFKFLTSVLYARIIIMVHKHGDLCMLKSAISRHI